MRVIFLDVDGVLNSLHFMRSRGPSWDGADAFDRQIDRAAVERVNRIVRRARAKIVLSSTWRLGPSMTTLRNGFRRCGLRASIIGKTPDLGGNRDPKSGLWLEPQPRGNEIQAWLDAHQGAVESFVILDDDSDMAHLAPRLVQTTWAGGLLEEHVDRAVKLLLSVSPTPASARREEKGGVGE